MGVFMYKKIKILVAVIIISFGFVITVPSKPAYSCEIAATATAAIADFWRSSIGKVIAFLNQTRNYIEDIMNKAQFEAVERLGEFDQNIRESIGDDFWSAYFPDMRSQTKQLHVAEIEQSRTRCSFADAENQTNSQRDKSAEEANAHRRFRIDSTTCQAESIKQTLTETKKLTRAIAKAVTAGEENRLDGRVGSISAEGPEREAYLLNQKINTNFCIDGQNGCTGNGPRPMGHILITNLTDGAQKTIDLTIPENRVMVETAAANFTTPTSPPKIPADVASSKKIMEEVVFKRRPMLARKSMLNYIIGKNLGEAVSGNYNPLVGETREGSNIHPSRLSANPSKNSILEAMRERLLSNMFVKSIIVDPEDLLRRMATFKEQQMRTWLEIKDINEERLALLALILGQELTNDRIGSGSAMVSKPR